MPKKLTLVLGLAVVLAVAVVVLRTSFGTEMVWRATDGGRLLLPLLVISALLDSIHPCAFAILLVTIAVLMGLGSMRRKVFVVGGTYIAGIFTAYLGIGLGLLGTLHFFDIPNFMGRVGAAILIIWGMINLLNVLIPSFPIVFKIPHAAHRSMARLMGQASILAAFGLGVLVGLCAFPCSGGPYLLVLGLLHDSATYAQGFLYLLLYNALFVLPLVIMLLIVGDRTVVARMEQWKKENVRGMRLWTGVAMILFGVLIFFL